MKSQGSGKKAHMGRGWEKRPWPEADGPRKNLTFYYIIFGCELSIGKIAQKNNLFGEAINFMNSNEFKKLKHNISNHSIDKVISSGFTQYEKKQKINIKKRINEVKKNYVSPYSKKIIENNLYI